MKKEELEKLPTEELEKKIKSGNSILYAALMLFIIYGVYMIYQMIQGTWEPGVQIAVPLFLFAALIPNWVNIKNMKEELQKRNSKQ
jgi:hypothetical protein